MFDKNLPTDLLNIICKFAYNIKMKTDPIKDIELQKNIQESIPPCFLMSRLPKPEWFTTQNHPLCGPCNAFTTWTVFSSPLHLRKETRTTRPVE